MKSEELTYLVFLLGYWVLSVGYWIFNVNLKHSESAVCANTK